MTPVAQVLATLDALAPGYPSEGNVLILCPFRAETTPSCSVNLSSGLFNCFGCGAKGDIYQLVAAMQGFSTLKAGLFIAALLPEDIITSRRESFPSSISLEQSAEAYQRYLQAVPVDWYTIGNHYLLDRRAFEPRTLERFKVRLNPRSVYEILIPLTVQQRFMGYVCRRSDDLWKPKYKNNKGFLRASHLIGDLVCGPVLVVEGMFDRMRAWEHGFSNTAALMGSSITDAQYDQLLRYASAVILGQDPDVAGQQGAKKLQARLQADGVPVSLFPWKEGQEDIGALARDEFRSSLGTLGYGKLLK